MMRTSESINELATALSKCQSEMGSAEMGADNPFFNSKYANISDVLKAIKAPLGNNGLSFVQTPISKDNEAGVTTRLMHVSGQWMESTLCLPVLKADPQGVGSVVTYSRRYALQSILGVPAADDDGNAVSVPSVTAEEVTAGYLTAREYLGGNKTPSEFMEWRATLSEELANLIFNAAPKGKIQAFKDHWTKKERTFWAPLKEAKKQMPDLVANQSDGSINEIFQELDKYETTKLMEILDDVSLTYIAQIGEAA